jgi:hypothetical protein
VVRERRGRGMCVKKQGLGIRQQKQRKKIRRTREREGRGRERQLTDFGGTEQAFATVTNSFQVKTRSLCSAALCWHSCERPRQKLARAKIS